MPPQHQSRTNCNQYQEKVFKANKLQISNNCITSYLFWPLVCRASMNVFFYYGSVLSIHVGAGP